MRICLAMVCRDEPKVIRRALESALPFIDCWEISYNGSGEETPSIINDVLGHLPGRISDQPWHDYGTNRTMALDLVRDIDDHDIVTLMVDADEVVETSLSREELHSRLRGVDGARVTKVTGTLEYPMILLTGNMSDPWRYSWRRP